VSWGATAEALLQAFEVCALRFVASWWPSDAVVRVPTVHHFDEVAHVIIMDDCGDGQPNLKDFFL
jgi:hypothetical protein